MPFGLHFSGKLNITALESSLQLLINRYESLRTNFITVDGEPLGAIAATRDFTLPVIDLRPLPSLRPPHPQTSITGNSFDILVHLDFPYSISQKRLWLTPYPQLSDELLLPGVLLPHPKQLHRV